MVFFFFNDTATTEIYTLSLHDALPISQGVTLIALGEGEKLAGLERIAEAEEGKDRKSTRLNSSHSQISYAVFCLKKKKRQICSKLGSLPSKALSVRTLTCLSLPRLIRQ